MPRERRGNTHFAAAPGDHFKTNDGRFIALTIAADGVFRRLCNAIGMPELSDDARCVSHGDRSRNCDEINGIVAAWIMSRPVDEVCATLTSHSVPHSLVYTVADIMKDPHYAARGSIATVEHPKLGSIRMPAVLPLMSGTPPPDIRNAPDLGADTISILTEFLGLSSRELDTLRQEGVI
jgi:formyl-CoA transferase